MNQEQLRYILSTPFSSEAWTSVLKDVFGVRTLLKEPQEISLPANEIAEKAFELGSFNTSDDRIVGIYRVNIKKHTQIGRNRVGLRSLLRSVYKNDVDAALVAFVQKEKWRLSFISEIRVLNDDGSIETKITQPKRFTYLLGPGEKTNTPTQRLAVLAGQKLALEGIRKAFSVEILNKEFYGKVSKKFYELVGATEGKGKKQIKHERILKLPDTPAEARTKYQEFAVRLIGRLVFCWFLKEKMSKNDKPLIPGGLVESDAVQKNYYHSILEPLFFQTLNTPMDSRVSGLPKGCEFIPFLNGGLFEPHSDDHYELNKGTGVSNHLNTLKIPDEWFREFFATLEEYNFTIDENSPVDIEISIDPEMLGRIFENLLAEIDPDSGESARKATGSFYTPREIVNYMVDESLILYLKGKLDTKNEDELENSLRQLVSYNNSENPFNPKDTKTLIEAIDECKILDPACGSGAFPIGMLQRLVFILEKLDSKNEKWKSTQIDKVNQLIEDSKNIEDHQIRTKIFGDLQKRKGEIESAFAEAELNFGRKLFLIENCIYGVDIQPIAAEISKLRCFLTLIIDETIDDTAENRGVKPLPNLEFKFVTADTLRKLPPSGLFNSNHLLEKLEQIRHDYIQSYGEEKAKLKADFKQLQDKIFDEQLANFAGHQDARALALSIWEPFSEKKVDWFDPEWMFGITTFDIVIGNPPYVQLQKDGGRLSKMYSGQEYRTFFGTGDLYCLFFEVAFDYLKVEGILAYINPNTWLQSITFNKVRLFLTRNFCWNSILLTDKVFEATVDTHCLIFQKCSGFNGNFLVYEKNRGHIIFSHSIDWESIPSDGSVINISKNTNEKIIFDRIVNENETLKTFCNVFNGVKPFEKGKGKPPQTEEIMRTKPYVVEGAKPGKEWKPLLRGSLIHKYKCFWDNNYWILYGEWLSAPRNPEIFEADRKIVIRQTGDSLIATKIGKGIICRDNLHIIIPKGDQLINFVLALLNSRLLDFVYSIVNPEKGEALAQVKKSHVEGLPICSTTIEKQKVFEYLVDYIFFLNESDKSGQVNEYVPNSHLVEQFEEVIDALVYELYFEEDFRKAKIEFLKYAERDFPSVEGLSQKKKIETIEAAYQRLRQKDNEIRNNLKLMDIHLADLIGPIKSAR